MRSVRVFRISRTYVSKNVRPPYHTTRTTYCRVAQLGGGFQNSVKILSKIWKAVRP